MLVEIRNIEGQLKIAHNQKMFLYINNTALEQKEGILSYGDIINILGLKIMILPNAIIINNPQKSVYIDSQNVFLTPFTYNFEEYKNLEIKDLDLYSKEQYFSKSPRIRRT